jgi:hypothetical protein
MDEELPRRIAEDLRKSGRASEMLAIDAFIRRGWICEGSSDFHDKDEDLSRELDIQAHRGLTRSLPSGGSVLFTLRIVGEVKKSEKPWVALRDQSLARKDLVDGWTNLTCKANLPDDLVALGTELSRHSLLESTGWRARAFHEAFKHPNAPEASYSACIVACKAAESVLETEDAVFGKLGAGLADSMFLTLVKPLVILDGLLFSATLGADA